MNDDSKQIDEKLLRETAKKMFTECYSLRELKGITDAEMEAVYALGFNFYNSGRIDDAEQIFRFLVMFDHMSPRYWIGMGAVLQVKKNFKGAITAYEFAAFLDITDPKPLYLAGECYFALGDIENAKASLEGVRRFSDEKTEKGKLYREKANALQARIDAE